MHNPDDYLRRQILERFACKKTKAFPISSFEMRPNDSGCSVASALVASHRLRARHGQGCGCVTHLWSAADSMVLIDQFCNRGSAIGLKARSLDIYAGLLSRLEAGMFENLLLVGGDA